MRLASLAELMEAHEDDCARLRKLEGEASENVGVFDPTLISTFA
jgi:hypothetical protein